MMEAQVVLPINSSFYLTIYTYILGRVGISKYMEYQDVAGVAKDVICRQKNHSSDIENQNVIN